MRRRDSGDEGGEMKDGLKILAIALIAPAVLMFYLIGLFVLIKWCGWFFGLTP
jgi:hypothetical protein